MAIFKNRYVKHSINIFLILFGTFLMGTAYNMFYGPNNIILGGFGGIATIISFLFSKIGINISISTLYLIMNIALFIIALKTLGKTFSIYSVFGILGYSLFLEICKFPSISNDLLISGIYGGVISGFGMGIVIRIGGSTGGGDMLGCLVNSKKPNISVGWMVIIIDAIVIAISIFLYGLDRSLYAIIAIFIYGKTSDLIIEGPKSVKALYIISKKPDEISRIIMNLVQRGVTSFEAYGKYSGNQVQVLMCLANGNQIAQIKQIVYSIDKDAFMFSVPVKEAMGKGFRKLEKKQGLIFMKEILKPAKVIDKKFSFQIQQKTEKIKINNIFKTKNKKIIKK